MRCILNLALLANMVTPVVFSADEPRIHDMVVGEVDFFNSGTLVCAGKTDLKSQAVLSRRNSLNDSILTLFTGETKTFGQTLVRCGYTKLESTVFFVDYGCREGAYYYPLRRILQISEFEDERIPEKILSELAAKCAESRSELHFSGRDDLPRRVQFRNSLADLPPLKRNVPLKD